MNEWIEQRIKMIDEGFSLEQIQRECWDYCHREYLGILNLEAIIGRAMQLYAEVIKRSGVQHYAQRLRLCAVAEFKKQNLKICRTII